jgi:hypothetical protein
VTLSNRFLKSSALLQQAFAFAVSFSWTYTLQRFVCALSKSRIEFIHLSWLSRIAFSASKFFSIKSKAGSIGVGGGWKAMAKATSSVIIISHPAGHLNLFQLSACSIPGRVTDAGNAVLLFRAMMLFIGAIVK